ncbi:MAG TPA: hypothetical protein VMT46_11400 [Anaerolineaceae bacterium]|nr:hypothetical protein [Anaerolineaceae bacterium]
MQCANCVIQSKIYPIPLVDHTAARRRALVASAVRSGKALPPSRSGDFG